MALEDYAFVSYASEVPPLLGSRHWNDLSYEEQDSFILSCFKGPVAREDVAKNLELFDRIALSIARNLLGDKFYEYQPKNDEDVQALAACRFRDLENTLLGQKLLCVLTRKELRSQGRTLGTHSAEDDPMLFFDYLDTAKTKGFEYLSPNCTTTMDELEAETRDAFNKLSYAEQQQHLSEIKEEIRKALEVPHEISDILIPRKEVAASSHRANHPILYVLSFFGPVYFALKGLDYLWLVPAWAIICSADFAWQHRHEIKQARDEQFPAHGSWIWRQIAYLFLLFAIAAAFITLHSAVYFVVRALVK